MHREADSESIESTLQTTAKPADAIRLRGGRTHNLKSIDIDVPLGKLIVVCGVSGSGKTSLAFDTLYVEGQRRYIECFSPYARQFLPQREKPDFDLLDPLPAAIAVKRGSVPRTNRVTVGTTAEIDDYLRILFARLSQLFCPTCHRKVERHEPSSVAGWLGELARCKAMIVVPRAWVDAADLAMQFAALQQEGFTRWVIAERTWNLADTRDELAAVIDGQRLGYVVVDRIQTGEQSTRIIESLETAFVLGHGAMEVWTECEANDQSGDAVRRVDGRRFCCHRFSRELYCEPCERSFADPEPRMFSFNSPFGACEECEGEGEIAKPLDNREGGQAASRKRVLITCPQCGGRRLRAESLAYQIQGRSIDQVLDLSVQQAAEWFKQLSLTVSERAIVAEPVRQIESRLGFLAMVGLGYLSLSRPLRTLSGGEATRVSLTNTLGSDLVSALYVLDEPTIGLHPHDTTQLIHAIEALRDRGNTVMVVEHEKQLIERADWLIEIGPRAGQQGGEVCFEGTVEALKVSACATGLAFRGGYHRPFVDSVDRLSKSTLQLRGASGRNLKDLDVDFPLECLCLVTGVSGSGKSTLVLDTLGAILLREQGDFSVSPLPFRSLEGATGIRECIVIDQDPIPLLSRSNPATYTKLFDDLRRLFAGTPEAKRRQFDLSHFSFNTAEGGCPRCRGEGELAIDMQFLADLRTPCPECKGNRYRAEILEVRYRDRSIAECLALSIDEARSFFRGEVKLQKKLGKLVEIGLGYLALGQRLSTLSTGEAQRLKLANYLSQSKDRGTLFLMDEPTTGLHFADVDRLIELLRKLVAAGHSIIVIEHNEQLIRAADHVIDLGPGAADEGGRVIAAGTPTRIVESPTSLTGRYLAKGG